MEPFTLMNRHVKYASGIFEYIRLFYINLVYQGKAKMFCQIVFKRICETLK